MKGRSKIGWLALLLFALHGCGDDSTQNPPPEGETIRFPGDAATLAEAIEMAEAGDTIQVGVGTHVVDATVTIPPERGGLTLIGSAETGRGGGGRPVLQFELNAEIDDAIVVEAPEVTIRGLEIRGAYRIGVVFSATDGELSDSVVYGPLSYCVWCPGENSDPRIEGNLLLDAGVFGVACMPGSSPEVVSNTIVGAGDCGIYSNGASPDCRQNIVVGSQQWGIACFGAPRPSLSCNALHGNESGPYSEACTPGETDIHEDPLFCDEVSYFLSPESPCAPANGACGGMGAGGVGCDGT